MRAHASRAPAALDVGGQRAQQLAAGRRERGDDGVDQAPVRGRVAAERALGQQVVGGDGARRVRPPGGGPQPGERLAGAGVGAGQVRGGRPDDHGPGPEGVDQRARPVGGARAARVR